MHFFEKSYPFFVKTISATPVLNKENFRKVFGGKDGKTLLQDEKGHIRSLEYISLKGSILKVVRSSSFDDIEILEVKTEKYPTEKKLYVDSRFVKEIKSYEEKKPVLEKLVFKKPVLTKKDILKNLEKMVGISYLWGGNYHKGIPELLSFYHPNGKINKKKWQLQGLDCSGLLYEATNGFTPRNTNELFAFGKLLKTNLLKSLKPLDLILMKGHILIALDSFYVIESMEKKGVVITSLKVRISELLQEKKYKNLSDFTVRRGFF